MPKMLANLPASGVINVSCGACPTSWVNAPQAACELEAEPDPRDRRVDVIWSCSYAAIYDAHV
jgi:hypothetical protein